MHEQLLRSGRGLLVLARLQRRILKCPQCKENLLRMGYDMGLISEQKNPEKIKESGQLLFEAACEGCQAYANKLLGRLIK